MYATRYAVPDPADCQYEWLDDWTDPDEAPDGEHVHACTLLEEHGGDCECECGALVFPPVPPGLGLRRSA